MKDLINKTIKQKFSEGDLEAFKEVYEAYYSLGLNYTKRLMPSFHIEDCRDTVQDTFLNIFRLRKDFDCSKTFNPYFFRALRNNVFKSLRDKKYNNQLKEDLKEECNLVVIDFAKNDSKKLTEKALKDLSVDQREAITLRFINGLKIAQIAAIIDVSENTVKTRIFYGLRKMRGLMLT